MKIFTQISVFTLGILNSCSQQEPMDVLFIGNSLTYYHEMPSMLQSMLNEKHSNVNIEQTTMPGGSLADHLRNEKTLEKIKSKQWDVLILQDGTVPVLIPEARKYKFENSIMKFDSISKLNYSKILLYQNYPISIYPERYCYPSFLISKNLKDTTFCSVELKNSDQEFKIIESSFEDIHQKIDCNIATVGLYFEICKKKFPELSLFESSTDTHPSKLGAYLIACVFFKELTHDKVSTISYSAGLDQQDLEKIKGIVDSN